MSLHLKQKCPCKHFPPSTGRSLFSSNSRQSRPSSKKKKKKKSHFPFLSSFSLLCGFFSLLFFHQVLCPQGLLFLFLLLLWRVLPTCDRPQVSTPIEPPSAGAEEYATHRAVAACETAATKHTHTHTYTTTATTRCQR